MLAVFAVKPNKNEINHLQTCTLRNVKRNSTSRSNNMMTPNGNLNLDDRIEKARSGNMSINFKSYFTSIFNLFER